jgi:hypothetical protein
MFWYVIAALLIASPVAYWEVRTRLQARAYRMQCGDVEPISLVCQYAERPHVPRFETYRDWTLGLDD